MWLARDTVFSYYGFLCTRTRDIFNINYLKIGETHLDDDSTSNRKLSLTSLVLHVDIMMNKPSKRLFNMIDWYLCGETRD